MATDSEPIGDLQPVGSARIPDSPGDDLVGRLDYGDQAQRAEMDGADEPPGDEPMELVDAPVPVSRPLVTGPLSRADKRRNQRR